MRRGELEDAPLLAALGRADLDARAAPSAQRIDDQRVDGLLDDDQRRHRGGGLVVAHQELLEHLVGRAARLVGEIEGLAIREHAVAHLEDLGVGVLPGERHGDRVERADGRVGDPLALEQRADGGEPVAFHRGFFELLLGGRRVHSLLDLALDLAVAPAEEVDDPVDPGAVLLARHIPDAGGGATVDMEIQTR